MGFGRPQRRQVLTRCALALAALFGCRAPDSHPGQRCDAIQACPEELACYRGFCVPDDEAREPSAPGPAAPSEGDDGVAEADASSAQPSRAGGDGQGSALGDQPAEETEPSRADGQNGAEPATSGRPATDAGTQPIVDSGRVGNDGAQRADAGAAPEAGAAPVDPTLAPIEAVACLAQCAGSSADEKECRKCVKKAFGVGPEELCVSADDDDEDDDESADTAPQDPLCAVLCLSGELLGVDCALSCTEPDCGSDQ